MRERRVGTPIRRGTSWRSSSKENYTFWAEGVTPKERAVFNRWLSQFSDLDPNSAIDPEGTVGLWRAAKAIAEKYEEDARNQRRFERAADILDVWAIVLPPRILNEDYGDFLEDISRRASEGQIVGTYLRTGLAIFWTGINAIGHFLKTLRRTKQAH